MRSSNFDSPKLSFSNRLIQKPSRSPREEGRRTWAIGDAMIPLSEQQLLLTRRHFFGRSATGIGVAALASLLGSPKAAGEHEAANKLAHFAPRAKRVMEFGPHSSRCSVLGGRVKCRQLPGTPGGGQGRQSLK